MKLKNVVIPVLMLSLLFVVDYAVAFGEKGAHWGGSGDKMICEKCEAEKFDKMAEKLNLSDQQKEQVKGHKAKKKEGMKAFSESLKENQKQLKIELEKPELDTLKIEQLTLELKEIEAKRIDARINGIIEMRKLLTPEQFKTMNESMHKKSKAKNEGGKKKTMKKDRKNKCSHYK